MTITNLAFISLFLTIALIVALISFTIVLNLNKKLTRAKSNEDNLNDDTKLINSQHIGSLTNYVSTNAELKNETIRLSGSTQGTVSIHATESNNNIRINIDPDFLHRVTSLVYREINNTENIIEVISSELCISSSQLNRKIKILTGMTTSNFILKTRLNRAKKQLMLTKKPIGEIGMECGFNDFAYFSRSFKKEFDMTPTTFQRMPQSINIIEN